MYVHSTVRGVSQGYSAHVKCAVRHALSRLFVDVHVNVHRKSYTYIHINIYHGFSYLQVFARLLIMNNRYFSFYILSLIRLHATVTNCKE